MRTLVKFDSFEYRCNQELNNVSQRLFHFFFHFHCIRCSGKIVYHLLSMYHMADMAAATAAVLAMEEATSHKQSSDEHWTTKAIKSYNHHSFLYYLSVSCMTNDNSMNNLRLGWNYNWFYTWPPLISSISYQWAGGQLCRNFQTSAAAKHAVHKQHNRTLCQLFLCNPSRLNEKSLIIFHHPPSIFRY